MTAEPRLVRTLDAVAAVAAVVIIGLHLWKTPVSAGGWSRRDLNDYTLNLRHSLAVAETREYPFGFTYPPPSALLRVALGKLGFELGGGLWVALTGASLLLSLGIALQMLGRWERPGAGILSLSCLLAVKYPIEFETKFLNCNAMFLVLVLGSVWQMDRRATLAGFLLSLSVALKLYSVAFVPWMLLTRRFRAAAATLAFSVIWFVAVPVAYWGWDGALDSTRSWLQRAAETGSVDFPVRFAANAYLVSLHSTVLTIMQRTGAPDPLHSAETATRILQFLWMAAVLFALFFRTNSQGGSRQLLLDSSLLLLLPLPLSGQLQPHHGVVLLPASMILLAVAADRAGSLSLRLFCGVVVIVSFVLMEFGPPRPWRGLVMNSVVLLHLIALFAVKRWSPFISRTAAEKAGSGIRPAP